jgi:CHAT domain-containing protein
MRLIVSREQLYSLRLMLMATVVVSLPTLATAEAAGEVCEPGDVTPSSISLAAAPSAALAGAAGEINPQALQIDALIHRAEVDQRTGRIPRALAGLREALAQAELIDDRRRIAVASGSLAITLQAAGAPAGARQALERSLEVAQALDDPVIEATTLINWGNLMAAEVGPDVPLARAIEAYTEAARLAAEAGRPSLAARASINAARLLARTGEMAAARDQLNDAVAELENAPDADALAFELISAGLIARDLAGASGSRQDLLFAHDLLSRAASLAQETGDARTESYALGYLGELYMSQGRDEEALRLSRRALFLAQSEQAREALYRWQWQVGRLLARNDEREAAIQAYEGAVETLQSIRQDLPAFDPETGRSLFRQTVGPVYLELADLLLQRAGERGVPAQADLIDARRVVEQLKTAELEDYFRDNCVALLQSQVRPIDEMAERSAALYPIILPDRLELLLSVADGLLRATVPVSAEELGAEARSLREALVSFQDPLPQAQKLHGWLIAPFADALAERRIETLIFVPDGALRLIPLSVLHDGERYVIERFALATAPGLSLIDPRPISLTEIRPLVSGLTEEVQGFPPLPSVERELESIVRLYGGTVLKDEAFNEERLRAELEAASYTVIHIASHAQFASDPDDTFLLTHDGRIAMDELETLLKVSEFREDPVELITLSACETAAGDDRAALGLAGIAVKAGARSAVATMWLVDDVAAARLSEEFYKNLGDPALTKAKALQRAQLALLKDFREPFIWAPFLLIGNWL